MRNSPNCSYLWNSVIMWFYSYRPHELPESLLCIKCVKHRLCSDQVVWFLINTTQGTIYKYTCFNNHSCNVLIRLLHWTNYTYNNVSNDVIERILVACAGILYYGYSYFSFISFVYSVNLKCEREMNNSRQGRKKIIENDISNNKNRNLLLESHYSTYALVCFNYWFNLFIVNIIVKENYYDKCFVLNCFMWFLCYCFH
jgi:hypothetical protein